MATSEQPSKPSASTRASTPVRSVGESEARLASPYAMDGLLNHPGVRSRTELEAQAAIATDPTIRLNPFYYMDLEKTGNRDFDGDATNLLRDEEYRTRRLMAATKFSIEHNWYEVLSASTNEIKDEEVTLPYEQLFVRIPYLGQGATVMQDQDDHSIIVFGMLDSKYQPIQASGEDYALFKQHVLCALVAMELGLTQTEPASLVDMGLSSTKTGVMTNIFRVVAVRRKTAAVDHNINTGRTAQRWHLRRSHWKMVKGVRKRIKWYAAGNIELGMVIKDYKLDDLL